MPLAPHKVEWLLGHDQHSRRVTLIHEMQGNVPTWTIGREAANQLDQSATLRGLTADILIEAGKIAAGQAERDA